jgi:glycosyltransferase involved in cell wall biosynthesis
LNKIKIIGPAYPFRGGIAAFNERLAYELTKNGHNVEIETFTIQYPAFLFPGKTQYSESEAPRGLNIRRTINSVSPLNWLRVGRRIRKENNDLVIFKFWLPFMGPCLGTLARIIRKNKKTVIISVLDNIVPHEKRPGDRLLTSYFIKSQDGFIAMSDSVLKELRTFTDSKPGIYSPHPVYDNYGASISREEALRKLGLEKEYRYLLFFGLVREYKGLDLLIKAFADKRLRELRLKVLVAGEFYEDKQKYTELINKLELAEDIYLEPRFIPDSEVAAWFCASDLIVQPYKSATQSGITQIGYQFEKPMLVTSVGGLPEIITHGKSGYVVEPEPLSIADAIYDFFINGRLSIMESGVKEDKKKFSWDRMINSIYELAGIKT